jgi:hypothetical protein
MGKSLSRLLCSVFLGALLGCSQEPVAVPVDSLSFPAILVIGVAPSGTKYRQARIVVDKEDLGLLRLSVFSALSNTTSSDVPIVIDSSASVFEMREIKGEKGGLWMMLNPNGLMPIQYTLVRHSKTGTEAARTMIETCDYLGRDLDGDRAQLRRQRIRQAQSMAEIIRIVDEMPERRSVR